MVRSLCLFDIHGTLLFPCHSLSISAPNGEGDFLLKTLSWFSLSNHVICWMLCRIAITSLLVLFILLQAIPIKRWRICVCVRERDRQTDSDRPQYLMELQGEANKSLPVHAPCSGGINHVVGEIDK